MASAPTHAPDPRIAMTEHDVFLFNEGTHYRLADHLGAHLVRVEGKPGVRFAVWAPSAKAVSVVGDFNHWQAGAHPMHPVGASGIWDTFIPDLTKGTVYKYHIESAVNDYRVDKADPFAFRAERPSDTASVVWDLAYTWNDAEWMATRHERHTLDRPISIYEVHLGSWMRPPGATHDDFNTYDQLAERLPDYVAERGFTHVELMPIMEHPLFRSWGYQTTGYFAPTSRLGEPQGLMRLIDALHARNVGVIIDWVPSHFPSDEHGLGYFDGTHLFEHEDPRLGFHPDWKSLIFNYQRHEVRAFLISSAMFWLEKYHADGIRVDAVASMLYRDYSRKAGEWIPNEHGGRENIEAIDFLQKLNTEIYRAFPDVHTFAEESTAWPDVSKPTYDGGLGFGFKWDMGWMHDTLAYFQRDPVYRKFHHHELTFRGMYMHAEHYCLPLSHDEVVHGKGSLYNKMVGDDWQRRANLRLLFANQWTQPGRKLLFMGGEIAQHDEWNFESEIAWHLLEREEHLGIQRLVDRLNDLYRTEPALHQRDSEPQGFRWLVVGDHTYSTFAYLRVGRPDTRSVLCLFNCTPEAREGYLVGAPEPGRYEVLLNTDHPAFGGSGVGPGEPIETHAIPLHDLPCSLRLTLPPLGAILLAHAGDPDAATPYN